MLNMPKDLEDPIWNVIIPVYDNSGRRIDPEVRRKYIEELGQRFGGFTAFPRIIGCWYNHETKENECDISDLIFVARDLDEPGDVESACKYIKEHESKYLPTECTREEIISKDAEWIDDFLTRIGLEFGQSAMYVEEDMGDVEFVPGDWKRKMDDNLVTSERVERPVTNLLY